MIHPSVQSLFDQIKSDFDFISTQGKKDGYQSELLVGQGESLSVKYKKQSLDSFNAGQDMMAGFRVIIDGIEGYSYTEKVDRSGLLACYNEAVQNALTKKSESSELPEKVSLIKPQPQQISYQLSDYYFDEEVSQDQLQDLAFNLEKKAMESHSQVIGVPYSGAHESSRSWAVFNSEGVDQRFSQRSLSGYTYPLAAEAETKKLGGEDFFARRWNQIDLKKTVDEAVKSSIEKLGASRPKTGVYTVIFDQEVASTLLVMLSDYFSAKSVLEKKSLLEGRLGQKIAKEFITIVDDPMVIDSGASRPFDSEGFPAQKITLIQEGVLKTYLTHSSAARALGLKNTGHASRGPSSSLSVSCTNLLIEPGLHSLEDLLKSQDEVIVIKEFSGGLHAGFKASTGDFSMPAEGTLYRHGQLVGPVDQFVVSGNVLEIFRDVEAISHRQGKAGSSMRSPDLLVKGLSIAGC